MHRRNTSGTSLFLRAALLMSFAGCEDATAPSQIADPWEALTQAQPRDLSGLSARQISITGGGCKPGTVSLFQSPVGFELAFNAFQLENQDGSSTSRSTECAIEVRLPAVRGATYAAKGGVIMGSVVLPVGGSAEYGLGIGWSGERGALSTTGTRRGAYAGSWQERWEGLLVSQRCGLESVLQVRLPLTLRPGSGNSLVLARLLSANVEQVPCRAP